MEQIKQEVKNTFHLGIDLGSISLKVVLVGDSGEVAFEHWERVGGRPLHVLAEVFDRLENDFPFAQIAGRGVTGSGRSLIADILNARTVNEITAQTAACRKFHPEINSIIEIGGQDSKFIVLKSAEVGAAVSDFQMNELCAAGTGAFLDQQAARLCLTIDDFCRLALDAKSPVPIAGRCAVFAKSDMTHHQQEGRALPDIVAGLNESLVRSYMSGMVRGRKILKPVAFQGGVAANEGLTAAFKKILNLGDAELVVPKYYRVMGAIGAALVSKGSETSPQTLRDIASRVRRARENAKVKNAHDTARPLSPPSNAPLDADFKNPDFDGTYLGIDVGSISVKMAVVGPGGILFSDYRFSNGRPLEVLKKMISEKNISEFLGEKILGVGITGSGRNFAGKFLKADVVINEITALGAAAARIQPGTDTVFEIGGQDAKFLRLDGRRAVHFAMNRVCAAGTGAFLHEQAEKLHVDIEREFSDEAFASKNPAALGARCTVFMESDIVSHQQQGFSRRDLIAGLASSIVANYLEKVAAGHSIGDKILFVGGVAENRAVVSVMEAILGKPVATSKAGKISGAIGSAIAAFEAKREGKCGKLTGTSVSDVKKYPSLIEKRIQLLECKSVFGRATHDPSTALMAGARRTTRIGIPRALLTFDRMPAWRTFFNELGFEIVLSPPSDDKLFADGMKNLVAETCLPVKAFCAHLVWLEKHGRCDYIFVPSFVSAGRDRHDRETMHCPYIQSLAQFALPVVSTPLFSPVVHWLGHPKDELREMQKIAEKLGVNSASSGRAWRNAAVKLHEFRAKLKRMGDDVLAKLENGTLQRAFVILGKDYNICDPKLNSGVVKILESRGEAVMTQDMLADDGGFYPPAYRTMTWSHAKEILAAAEISARTAGLYPVMITSFGCGPDSFTTRYVRDILGGRPFLLLEVDEHTSSVGMETRIEAFIDSLPPQEVKKDFRPRPKYIPPIGIRRVYLPNFSDHGLAFAATVRSLGLEPLLTDLPDDESAKLGMGYVSSGECHPYTLMLGDYIKAAKKEGEALDVCYYMPESGLCRVGQFGTQMRLVAEEMGLKLPVFTRISELALQTAKNSLGATIKGLFTYWQMMRGMDFFMQKFLETRAYETTPGAAKKAHEKGLKVIMDHVMGGNSVIGLKSALEELKNVEVDKSRPRVKIGITGDYYTRVCDYANSGIFLDIERLGGVVLLPPTLSEFVKYNAHQKPRHAFNHLKIADFIQWSLLRAVVNRKEREIRSIFDGAIDYDVPLEYDRAMKLIEPYMSRKLPTGLTGSVAAIMEQISAGADGILNLITFHCSYGLVISSVLAEIGKKYPNLPRLTLIFEGLKPTHNQTRLEAFMERILENRKRRKVQD